MINPHPKVSLVIPVYNGADYLHEAIRSALAQTYENLEIIVVNDGSNDNGATDTIAREYGGSIRYIARENGGVAAALNTAISAMTGDYLSWLSHDDLYSPNKVEREVHALLSIDEQNRDRAIIYSDYAVFSNAPSLATEVRLEGVRPEAFRYWLTAKNTLHGCTLLVPRNAFLQMGVFDETLRTTQDFDLWFRLASIYEFHHLPEVLVYARSHPEQGTVTMAGKAHEEGNALLIRFVQGLTQNDLKAGGHANSLDAYSALARSFWRRGFTAAARVASRTALAARPEISLSKQAVPLSMLVLAPLEMRFWETARRLLKPHHRARIRRALSLVKGKQRVKSLETADLKKRFSRIYRENIFGGGISRSGEGSDLVQTEIIRREIPVLLKRLGVRSLLDAPCGDWHWMQKTKLGVDEYIGVDLVEEMIDLNNRKFGNEHVRFASLDLTRDALPDVDLIFSRDCLVHLSSKDALRVVENFKRSGARYLLTTTFTDRSKNAELAGRDAFWRPLNMQLEPFNFPEPVALINEGCTEERGNYRDKCLGLWILADIHISPQSDDSRRP
jgi:hypothetical protein